MLSYNSNSLSNTFRAASLNLYLIGSECNTFVILCDEVVDITDQLIDEFERQIPKQSITSVVATTTDESDKDSAPIERDTDNENSSEDTDSSDESNDDDDDEFYVVGPSIYCL